MCCPVRTWKTIGLKWHCLTSTLSLDSWQFYSYKGEDSVDKALAFDLQIHSLRDKAASLVIWA